MGTLNLRVVRLSALALGLLTASLFMAGNAWAVCSCACADGKPRAMCTTSLEKPPICPARVCNPNAVTDKPPMPAMPGGSNCTIVQKLDPVTHAIERERVCK
jgi:hypothetical protein